MISLLTSAAQYIHRLVRQADRIFLPEIHMVQSKEASRHTWGETLMQLTRIPQAGDLLSQIIRTGAPQVFSVMTRRKRADAPTQSVARYSRI